ncbi:hypothetical protein CLOM_g3234, partial [Closterium sp. NIES-68]
LQRDDERRGEERHLQRDDERRGEERHLQRDDERRGEERHLLRDDERRGEERHLQRDDARRETFEAPQRDGDEMREGYEGEQAEGRKQGVRREGVENVEHGSKEGKEEGRCDGADEGDVSSYDLIRLLVHLPSPPRDSGFSLPVSPASQHVTGQVPQPTPLSLLMLPLEIPKRGGVITATFHVNISTKGKPRPPLHFLSVGLAPLPLHSPFAPSSSSPSHSSPSNSLSLLSLVSSIFRPLHLPLSSGSSYQQQQQQGKPQANGQHSHQQQQKRQQQQQQQQQQRQQQQQQQQQQLLSVFSLPPAAAHLSLHLRLLPSHSPTTSHPSEMQPNSTGCHPAVAILASADAAASEAATAGGGPGHGSSQGSYKIQYTHTFHQSALLELDSPPPHLTRPSCHHCNHHHGNHHHHCHYLSHKHQEESGGSEPHCHSQSGNGSGGSSSGLSLMLLVDPSCPSSLLLSVDLPRSLTSLLLSSLPLLIGSALSLTLCASSYHFSHSLSLTHSLSRSHSQSTSTSSPLAFTSPSPSPSSFPPPSFHNLPSLLSLTASSPWPSLSNPTSRSLLSSAILFSLLHSLSHSSHSTLPLPPSNPLDSRLTHSLFPYLQPHSASSSCHPLPPYYSLLSPLLLSLPSLPRLSPTLTSFLHTLTSSLLSSLHSSLHSSLPSSLLSLLPSPLRLDPNQPPHATSLLPLLASARCMLSCIFSTLTSALLSLSVAVVIASAALCLLVALLKVTLKVLSCCAGSQSDSWADQGTNTGTGYWPPFLFLFLLLPLSIFSPFIALLLAAVVQVWRTSRAKARSSFTLVSELLLADAFLLLLAALFHLPPFIAHLHAKASISMAPLEDLLPSVASLLLVVTPLPCSFQSPPNPHYKPTALQQVVVFVCDLCGVASFVFSLYMVPGYSLNAIALVAVSRSIMSLQHLEGTAQQYTCGLWFAVGNLHPL